jgi:acetolactate synthase small subunit
VKVKNDYLKTSEFQALITKHSLGLINMNDSYSTFELASDNKTITGFLKAMDVDMITKITRTGVSGINISIE